MLYSNHMKRFSKMLILLVAFIMFAAPVGVSLQIPSQPEEIFNQSENFSQKTTSLSLELQVADAGFIQLEDCDDGLIWCGVKRGLLEFFELIWFQTTQVLAAITAVIVDFLLIHSISSSTYTSGLIEAGWEILRDFVNIVFIFALLIIAFNIVLDREGSNNKKMLVKTLLVALVLNFSLFITYAVIDASNIFAHLFYDRIETTGEVYVQGQGGGGDEGDSAQSLSEFFSGFTGAKSPSIAILSTFNPQKIITGAGTVGFFESFLIIFFAGAMNILIAYVFISVALLFLGRTVGLMLLGIFAPLAFGTLTIPNAQNIDWIGFNTWWRQLLSLAFMAPIYLLLLYLTVTFAINEGVLASIANIGGGTSVISSILSVVLPFALIAMLLMVALKVTKKLSGELGGMIVDYAKKGIGGAVAAGAIVATGGAAALGGAARGAGMLAGKESAVGKRLQGFGKGLQATNFNFAQTRVGKLASKASGINMGENLGNLSYARAETAAYRTGGAMARGVDNTLSGKPSEAVTKWQDNVRAERDKTVLTRIENEQRNAVEKATGQIIQSVNPDGSTNLDTNGKLEDKLKTLQARKARMSAQELKDDKKRIEEEKQVQQLKIDAEQDEIRLLNRQNQELQKQINALPVGDPGRVTLQGEIDTNKTTIEDKRKDIDSIKETIKDIEKTSVDGMIEQVAKQIDSKKNDARADVLNNKDVVQSQSLGRVIGGRTIGRGNPNRYMTGKGQTRIVTGDTDAARVATGDIKTSPTVGKTPDTK